MTTFTHLWIFGGKMHKSNCVLVKMHQGVTDVCVLARCTQIKFGMESMMMIGPVVLHQTEAQAWICSLIGGREQALSQECVSSNVSAESHPNYLKISSLP